MPSGPEDLVDSFFDALNRGDARGDALVAPRRGHDQLRATIARIRPSLDVTQCLQLVDHAHVVQTPIVLGRGVRLWDGLEALEDAYDIEATSSPSGVTHLTLTRRAPRES